MLEIAPCVLLDGSRTVRGHADDALLDMPVPMSRLKLFV
jgi:hypothetical protein